VLSARSRGVGDFDGDGRADILFHHATGGGTVIWYMVGASWVDDREAAAPPRARIAGVADFDNDGRDDVLWLSGAKLTIWFGGETSRVATLQPGASVVGAGWTIADVRDFNRDGRSDLLWQEAKTGHSRCGSSPAAGSGGKSIRAYRRGPRSWSAVSRRRARLPVDCEERGAADGRGGAHLAPPRPHPSRPRDVAATGPLESPQHRLNGARSTPAISPQGLPCAGWK
jgi:hypothetical protein